MRSKNIKSFGWLLFDKAYKSILGITVFVYIARKLGPEVFGVIAVAYGILVVINTVSGFGLDSLIVRDLASGSPDAISNRISSVISIRLMSAFFAYTLAVVYIWDAVPNSIDFILTGVILSSVFYTPFGLFYAKHQVDGSFNRIVVSQGIAVILCASLRFLVVYLELPLYWLAIAIHLEGLVAAILVFWQCPSLHKIKINFPDWSIVRGYIKQGLPLLISGLAIILYMRLDQFMLADMAATDQVGQYSVAVKFVEIWYFVPVSISAVILPGLSAMKIRSPLQFDEMIDRLTHVICALGWLIVIVISIGSYFIIPLILGPKFVVAVNVVLVYQLSLLFVFMGVVRGQYLVIEGRTKIEMIATLLGLAANVALNLFLIPRYGAIGAAIATVISYSFSAYFSSFLFPSTRAYAITQSRAVIGILSPVKTLKMFRQFYYDKIKVKANSAATV